MITYPIAFESFTSPADLPVPWPTRWSRSPVSLAMTSPPAYLPLGALSVSPSSGCEELTVQTFLTRYALAGAMVDGVQRPPDDPGYFIVFYVCQTTPLGVNVWTLSQVASPVFSDMPVRKDYLPASKVGKQAPTATGQLPSWKKGDANWPTVDGHLMSFVGEVELQDTPLNREHGTTGERVYWFAHCVVGAWRFKAFTQAVRFQSVEDHYRGEAGRCPQQQEA